MPIGAIILTVAGIVALITGSTVIGIVCLVVAAALFGYAYIKRSQSPPAPKPG